MEVPHYKDEQAIVCDGGITATKKTKTTVTLSKYPNNVLPLQNVTGKGELIEYPDMVDIPFLHEVSRVKLKKEVKKTTFLFCWNRVF